jgi:hypothetical protein
MKRPHSFSIATNPDFYFTQYVNSQNNKYLSAENPIFIQNVPAYDVIDGVSHASFSISPYIHTNITYVLFFHHLQQSATSHTPNHSVCCVDSIFGGTGIRRMCNKIKGPSKHNFHFTSKLLTS